MAKYRTRGYNMEFEILNNLSIYFRHFLISYVVFINALYAFIKTQNIKPSKRRIVVVCALNIVISMIYSFLATNEMIALSQIVSYVSVVFSLLITKDNNRNKSLIIAFISTSYAHVLKICSFYIAPTALYIIFGPVQNIIPYVLSCVVSIMMNFFIMRIKRLKNGIKFFEKTENFGIGIVVSGIVFLITIIGFGENPDMILFILITFGIIICGFGLYLWIRKGITKHYREKLQLKSEIYYKEQLEQKEHDIERLNQSNEYLAKIVHRDNHLMSSLDSSINAYFESDDKEFKDGILHEIQTLSKERGELIKTEQRDVKLFPSTGNMLIDGAISDLYIKAASHGIDFDVSVSATVDEVIGKYISQTDLQTLICDHIKDAIIAIDAKSENGGKILIDLSMQEGNYAVTFFDSGVDFEIDTLAKLGKERVTTHADNGGSGIGFMTTFETLRKSYASLIVNEFENKTPFSKSISIRFDGNTAFIIQSYRKEELKSVLNRDDLVLL